MAIASETIYPKIVIWQNFLGVGNFMLTCKMTQMLEQRLCYQKDTDISNVFKKVKGGGGGRGKENFIFTFPLLPTSSPQVR